jgi:hypothetical protein
VRWRSSDGVWDVFVLDRNGQLRYEITCRGGLAKAGWVSVLRAHQELDEVLAALGGPPLAEMAEV